MSTMHLMLTASGPETDNTACGSYVVPSVVTRRAADVTCKRCRRTKLHRQRQLEGARQAAAAVRGAR